MIWLIVSLVSVFGGAREKTAPSAAAAATEAPTAEPTPEPTPTPIPYPTPRALADTAPSVFGITEHIEAQGKAADHYQRTPVIDVPAGGSYNAVQGILTFRGNQKRDASSFGTATLTEYAMAKYASVPVGSLRKGSGSGNWSGCGWTGQPLIVRWTDEVRACMTSLYSEYRDRPNFTEVIYPTEDGCVYFFDLDTGKQTRETLNFHMPFKGTGSIDPRGWPLLYLGSGDQYDNDSQKARAMVVSLIDGKKLYEFGVQGEDAFAVRNWYSYDSAPLIDAKTDTLIWPGENGVVYTIKLNTSFSAKAGAVSVKPSDTVKFRYDSANSYTGIDLEDAAHKWLGYEGSASLWHGYLYLSSNDGLLQCLDLNTMSLKWVANTVDDTNASPVLEVISDEEAYLYVGTSLHFTKDGNHTGKTPFVKVNALTGEIVKEFSLTCETVSGVSGGIQATAALGKNKLKDLVYVTFARCGGKDAGVLVALNKNTLEVVWQHEMECYSWSSPAVVYDRNGSGVVIQPDSGGHITMLDGLTGEVKSAIRPTETSFEATPAVFEDKLILGCRGDQTIFLIRLS